MIWCPATLSFWKKVRFGRALHFFCPGSLFFLKGDAVPADLRIVEASQLEIVEALLTGESVPVAKNPKHIRAAVRLALAVWLEI
jgi:hypothetical protein